MFGRSGDRRDFFKDSLGEWAKRFVASTEEKVVQQRYFRPPGALPEMAFLAACTRCGECLPVCPAHAIVKVPTSGGLAAGTPRIDPALQPCTVCPDMPCVQACPTEALTMPADGWNHYRIGILELIPERCVTFQGTPCTVCVQACPVGERALVSDAQGHPVLRQEGCVGCGVCMRSCITYPSSYQLRVAEA